MAEALDRGNGGIVPPRRDGKEAAVKRTGSNEQAWSHSFSWPIADHDLFPIQNGSSGSAPWRARSSTLRPVEWLGRVTDRRT